MLEKALESPLDSKEIQPVNPKGNQPWIFIVRTGAEAPSFWPPDAKNWLIGKDPDAGKDWRQEEKRTTEDEMVEWHLWLNGHEFEPTLGDSEGQGSLAYWGWWVLKELSTLIRFSDWTTRAVSYCGGEVRRSDFPRLHRALSFCGNELSIARRTQPWGPPGVGQRTVPGLSESQWAAEGRDVFALGDHPAGSQFFPSLPASLGPGLHLPSEVSVLYEF